MSDDLAARLDAHIAERVDSRKLGWVDKLPEEVQEIILTSPHSSAGIASWLLTEGFEGATYAKVDAWRRKKAAESAGPSES
jgi:hypothetical protein